MNIPIPAALAALLLAAPAVPAQAAPAQAAPATPALPPAPGAPPAAAPAPAVPTIPAPPAPRQEFRAVWVATVANIDWPSKPGLSTAEQKAELLAILDRTKQLGMNAVVFQVRPAADAFYNSPYEPWSEYLTGRQGQAPSPYYDPLEFAVSEAHKRGLELHAWFNPYRARQQSAKSPAAPNHISVTRPDLAKPYGTQVWMDPAEPEVQDISTKVILDVVKRYDIDGVHMDDYFYPYVEKDAAGNAIPFPDDPEWQKYQASGGTLSRSDWRRENVNKLIQRVAAGIKSAKPWVKFGISPFGIWRPGNPGQIKGFDAYEEIYCDSRKWLQEGWVDYVAPQLYWKIETTAQSFPVLLGWWTAPEQNPKGRHVWPGLYSSRAVGGEDGKPAAWPADEVIYQIRTTRGFAGATGDILFSAKSVLLPDAAGGIGGALSAALYTEPALIPAFPWLSLGTPAAPSSLKLDGTAVQWKPGAGGSPVRSWAVQTHSGKTWTTAAVLPPDQNRFALPPGIDAVAVTAADRVGDLSPAAVLPVPQKAANASAPARRRGRRR